MLNDLYVLQLYQESSLLRLAVWFGWGALTKFIDLHFDDGYFPRWLVYLVSIFCGITVGLCMVNHSDTMLLYGAILISCVLTGKIDNLGFRLPIVLICLIIIATLLTTGLPFLLTTKFFILLPILVLGFSADEWVNDYLDRRPLDPLRQPSRLAKFGHLMATHRNLSLIWDISIWLSGALPLTSVLMPVCFDLGYYAMYGTGWHLSRIRLRTT